MTLNLAWSLAFQAKLMPHLSPSTMEAIAACIAVTGLPRIDERNRHHCLARWRLLGFVFHGPDGEDLTDKVVVALAGGGGTDNNVKLIGDGEFIANVYLKAVKQATEDIKVLLSKEKEDEPNQDAGHTNDTRREGDAAG